jgi:hypothetical protein
MEPHRPDTLGPAMSGEADDPQLEAARAAFPDWEITRQWHGYEAVPKGYAGPPVDVPGRPPGEAARVEGGR